MPENQLAKLRALARAASFIDSNDKRLKAITESRGSKRSPGPSSRAAVSLSQAPSSDGGVSE
eukprot:CAMPEP_0171776954 /NCGR_PEP_ID=MMETSP0991-20121206/57476_1 /TAXON_ID=483369 /ORGANISM="non described non described, Strain CCMP2098" /LENGTH=61 /DNA_ID=CAMNT_0012383541 /DNA_START=36 /DNA_END=218 /DNA_ORIENTATION=+